MANQIQLNLRDINQLFNTVDPDGPPLWGDTFLDGLTLRECQQVLLWIKPPPGSSSLRYVDAP